MKKIICAALSLIMFILTFSSCTPDASTGGSMPKITEEQIKTQGFFTGTVKSVSDERLFEVDVDEQYSHALGKTVQVSLKWVSMITVRENDGLRVVFKNFPKSKGEPFNATKVQVTSLGDGREIFTEEFMEKYNITPVSEITIPMDFPNVSAFQKDETELTDSKEPFPTCESLRVVEITDDSVYLADFDSDYVTTAIKGIPFCNLSVGDYVKILANRYFTDENSYKIIDKNDVTSVQRLSEKEAQMIYIPPVLDKPVIYLYPEEETKVSVKVNIDGELTSTYPKHGKDGWQNFTAKPDGTLVSPEGNEYYCLYWEGIGNMTPDFSRGFCVKGEDTADFLADILPKIGLTAREANEFIIYWLPILEKNEYNLISFQDEAYTNVAALEVTPAPDSILRVFMAAKPLDAPVEIEPQEFEVFERSGFTVVEWGGSIIE